MLSAALVLIFHGDLLMDVDGTRVGIGQVLWLPGLIGSCACLWMLMTLSGARTNQSLAISLITLATAEGFVLLLPVQELSGMDWPTGNGLVPAISFASLALSAITWTATGIVDPLHQDWWTYGVALAAVALIGFILSYQYFWYLQGVVATSLAGTLVWGAVYDRRLHRYGDEKGKGDRGAPAAVFVATFLALPMLLLGPPYLLQ